ncbi:MAG TPA: hypothetical protein IAB53_12515 [Candidatus Scybalocola faecipullorum]|nr:hypothetical protein [Candidatus Scybalocola faecipullorum]
MMTITKTLINVYKNGHSLNKDYGFLCDTPGKRLPCLHGQTFAGQWTVSSGSCELFAVSQSSDRERNLSLSDRYARHEYSDERKCTVWKKT